MKTKIAILGLSLAAFSVPAFAATEFYVTKNESTKKCEVSETKPDGKTAMMLGKTGHNTKAEAEKAMKELAECK